MPRVRSVVQRLREGRVVEAECARVAEQMAFAERVLVLVQRVVQLPELAVVGRELGRFGGGSRVGMLRSGKLRNTKRNVSAYVFSSSFSTG